MRSILMFFVLLMYAACTKDVELDQPYYSSQVVVDGYIESGRPAYVYLTLSSPFLTHYDSVSIRQSFLNYAKVTLTSSDGEEEVLTLFRRDQFFPPFVYRSVKIEGKVGVSYSLQILVQGREVTATTSIPEPPVLKAVRYNQVNDSAGYLEYRVGCPNDSIMYLFAQTLSQKADKNFHPPINPLFSMDTKHDENSWLQVWRSRETFMYLEDRETDYYLYMKPNYAFGKVDTLWLKVGSVNRESYKVLTSLFVDKANQENPFAFNGNGLLTNVVGGIGRWTGIGSAQVSWVCGQTKPGVVYE